MLFTPFQTEANFLDSILGNQVSADAPDSISSSESSKNSQNMDILEPNTSLSSILQDKNEKNEIRNDENVNIVSENALLPMANHITIPGEVESGGSYSDQVSVYVVKKNDTLSEIAEMFEVTVQTILSANDMKKGDAIKEGDILFILPISGIEHTIAKGQSLQTIANLYKVNVSDITQFNGITEDAKLAVGDKILIPGGEMMDEGGDKPASDLNKSVTKDKNYYATHPIKSVTGYFINPVPTGHKTQGLHGPGNRGIDIGAPTGTPIYASASGTVLLAKNGWNGGYGNMVIVQHPNGTKTLYGHMSKLGTSSGAKVSQGQIIGYVGSTGHSTGPHVHFEVFNAKNPGADWSWKK